MQKDVTHDSKKEKQNSMEGHDAPSKTSHRCNSCCLGPLTFHPQAVGRMVHLSQGNRLAERNKDVFSDGLVFSSRPVKLREKICVKVLKSFSGWKGSLRVGFTTVSPSLRSLPLPTFAMPTLTDTRGHWAAPVPGFFCEPGSELKFWVSAGGHIYTSTNQSGKIKLQLGVDLSKPLWAMIDIYGQTCSILLLGSEKRGLIRRRSCPAPEPLISPECGSFLCLSSGDLGLDEDSANQTDVFEYSSCVVCMEKEARVTLDCGHRCLCKQCCSKVSWQFGTCPLCRHQIRAPSQQRTRVSACR